MAYRSRPRPSSTLGAKASTTCPYYLDGDQSRVATQGEPCGSTRLGEPVATTAAPEGTAVAVCDTCAVFKDRREGFDLVGRRSRTGARPRTETVGLSKLSSMRTRARKPAPSRTGRHARPRGPKPRGCPKALPRKEVIQPQLPLRLPCYDFTPVTSPTFDGSLPKGWATGFGCCSLPWCDGRCVQGPGTYSPRQC